MFTVKSTWETGKEQDVLNNLLFGNVNLISYERHDHKIEKKQSNVYEVNNLKRKASITDRGFRKKKGKYVINENSKETLIEDKFKTVNSISNPSHVSVDNKTDICCINKGPEKENKKHINIEGKGTELAKSRLKKRRKRVKKAKQPEEIAIEEFNKPQSCLNDKTLSSNVDSDINLKENHVFSEHEKNTGLTKTTAEKKGRKRKRTAKQTEEMTIEELNKPQACLNDKTLCSNVHADVNLKETHVFSDHEKNTGLTKSSLRRKRKMAKKAKETEEMAIKEFSDVNLKENLVFSTDKNNTEVIKSTAVKKGKKRKRKAKQTEEMAIEEFNKPQSCLNDKTLSSNVDSDINLKENHVFSEDDKNTGLTKTTAVKKGKKRKRKAKQTEEMVIEDSSEPQTYFSDNDKTLCNDVYSNGNLEENCSILNHDNDVEPSEPKTKKKKKKRQKQLIKQRKETVKSNEPQAHCNNQMLPIKICSGYDKKENDMLSNHKIELEKPKADKKRKKRKKGTVGPKDAIEKPNKCVVEENVNIENKNVECNPLSTNTSQSTKFTSKYNKFQQKIVEKLKGGQFRWINEKLYSCTSSDAVDMFSSDTKLFHVYHDGFTSQVQQWPQNPVDVIIEYIKERDSKLVIADFGCGDAKLSMSVPNNVHSFDLVAVNELVTACDMKKVPISRNSIDIAVFCLSLMGTNIVDFLVEAHRVIKAEGILKIAEVKSRFEDTEQFIEDVSSIGFTLIEKDESNKMFILMEFRKSKEVSSKRVSHITLKPCIYKRR